MPTNTSDWIANPVAAGNSKDAAKWYQSQGYQWTPGGWQAPRYGPNANSNFSSSSTSYPDRTLPSWYPKMGDITKEGEQAFGNIPGAFDTSGYAKSVDDATGRITTQAANAASNAAADYANRARQAGGNAEATGLIKAEGVVAGQKAVGDTKMEAAKFELEQREKAATLSGQIASQLGDLRNNYLATLAGYASKEDQIAASSGQGSGAGSVGNKNLDYWTTSIGAGIGHENDVVASNVARGGFLNLGTAGNVAQSQPWNLNAMLSGGG